ncbi:MAG: hypothetical protein ACOYJC_01840 [Christensenellales bacterium]|jgi:hypothetical protein
MDLDVLAWELDAAEEKLKAQGYDVKTMPTSSLRGVEGANSRRVIRQQTDEQTKTIRLVYSDFKTVL